MSSRNILVVSLVSLGLAMAGCQRSYEGPQRYPLSGTVTVDGEPVDDGAILFVDPSGGKALRPSGGEIIDGKFTVPEEKGANGGKYQVQISWPKKTGKKIRAPDTADEVYYDERKEALPPRFLGEKSELTAEVPSPSGTYDFTLTTK